MARRLVVEADGGSRGNPGVAGYGALVRDAVTGRVLVERAAPLGKESNNVAEYTGLIVGLESAYAVDPAAVIEVRMDSKLVVEQMSGRWKIKHEDMRRLALHARDVVAKITAAGGRVSYTWIPRELNKDADRLSNLGMDGEYIDTSAGGSAVEEDQADDAPASAEDQETAEATELVINPEGPDHERRGPTRIVLVRHGVTAFTEASRLDGRGGADPDLSERGREQARAAAANVAHLVPAGEARVVTSNLARARQTGAVIAEALGVEPIVDDAWDEQSFGDWDGESMSDLRRTQADALTQLAVDPTYARPGGESFDDLTARVVPALEAVIAHGGTTVVVCHRRTIMAVLAHVLGLTAEMSWRVAAAPGSLTALEVLPRGEVSVAFTNRV